MKQVKIKDTKLGEILPDSIEGGIYEETDDIGGHNKCLHEIDNTDITNIEEFVEIDVEKLGKMIDKIMTPKYPLIHDSRTDKIIETIASTKGVMKWVRNETENQVCPDCGGKVTDDGYTIDPERCCLTCKMD